MFQGTTIRHAEFVDRQCIFGNLADDWFTDTHVLSHLKGFLRSPYSLSLSFRKDYPGLKPEEYRLASLIFAGFDNTAIMIVMGITSLEYTRVKKNRLKNRIQKQPVPLMNTYLGFFK